MSSELFQENDSNESIIFNDISMYFFYGIFCKNPDIKSCYIGKTTNFYSRSATHKCESKISQRSMYVFIRNNGGFDNWNIKVLHKCVCDEKLSIYIEYALVQKYKDEGNQMLNTQLISIPCFNNTYNRDKCREHYKIKQTCACGWTGSKMNYAKHVKTSAKHRAYCIEKFEKDLENVIGANGCHPSHIC
jgi:hypothetical protein